MGGELNMLLERWGEGFPGLEFTCNVFREVALVFHNTLHRGDETRAGAQNPLVACSAVLLQGKSEADIAKAVELFSEIYQQIDSKQLKPFIRTQYMRSAFQASHELVMG